MSPHDILKNRSHLKITMFGNLASAHVLFIRLFRVAFCLISPETMSLRTERYFSTVRKFCYFSRKLVYGVNWHSRMLTYTLIRGECVPLMDSLDIDFFLGFRIQNVLGASELLAGHYWDSIEYWSLSDSQMWRKCFSIFVKKLKKWHKFEKLRLGKFCMCRKIFFKNANYSKRYQEIYNIDGLNEIAVVARDIYVRNTKRNIHTKNIKLLSNRRLKRYIN